MNENLKTLIQKAHKYSEGYVDGVRDREVFPNQEALKNLDHFESELPEKGISGKDMLSLLNDFGSPATVAQYGGRYFGFVNGGIHPPALAARLMADVWDQNAALHVISPIAAKLEDICEKWLVELIGLPKDTAVGFVSGTSTSLSCGFAAARQELLKRQGWDVSSKGLFGAPEIKVIVGEKAHGTVFKSLSFIGLGSERVHKVPCDEQGRMIVEEIPELDDKTLIILAAGNVNTGSFDQIRTICERANSANSWIHIDGAFGLWAGASKEKKHLCDGMELADSWSADAHKTLNAPYDCGIIFCKDRNALASTLQQTGAYIEWSKERDNMLYTPEMSRRARGIDLWALLITMGRQGVEALIDQLCDRAKLFEKRLSEAGFYIENDVVFNQVLIRCDSDQKTEDVLKYIQASGECWCGGSEWQGKKVIRVSVCAAETTVEDIERASSVFEKALKSTAI